MALNWLKNALYGGSVQAKNPDLEGLLDPQTTIYENRFQKSWNQTPLGVSVDAA
jgi:hypothetical protein